MFFEGDGRQMHRVLQRLAMDLDPDTEIYPGHEYTLPNLTFCSEMEPDNEGIMVEYSAGCWLIITHLAIRRDWRRSERFEKRSFRLFQVLYFKSR